jgi:hypothetical protein
MFETAQAEPSSGYGKIVGGVIAVVMIILGAFYFLYLREEPSATPQSGAAAAAGAPATPIGDADPMRDLSILKYNLGRDTTQTMAMWDLQIANRSRSYAYKDIQYATNYYDSNQNLLRQGQGTLSGQLGPGDQQTFSKINDGLYPVGTNNFTVELKSAQAVQQ